MVGRCRLYALGPLLSMVLIGCSTREPSPTPDLPPDYRFVLTSSCGERPALGTFRVEVVADAVTSAEPVDAGVPPPRHWGVPTLRELIAKVDEAERGAEVELVTDADGIPVTVDIDQSEDVVDDEECYEVTDYAPSG